LKSTIEKEFYQQIDKTKAFSNVLGISLIATYNHFAEARGLTRLPEFSNTTIPLITEIVMKVIYKAKYDDLFKELQEMDDGNLNFLGLGDDEYETYVDLEKTLNDYEETAIEATELLNLEGLKEIFEINEKVMSLIQSTKSVDEINKELKEIFLEIDS